MIRIAPVLTRQEAIDLAVRRTHPIWLAWIAAHPERHRVKLEAVARGGQHAIRAEFRRIMAAA